MFYIHCFVFSSNSLSSRKCRFSIFFLQMKTWRLKVKRWDWGSQFLIPIYPYATYLLKIFFWRSLRHPKAIPPSVYFYSSKWPDHSARNPNSFSTPRHTLFPTFCLLSVINYLALSLRKVSWFQPKLGIKSNFTPMPAVLAIAHSVKFTLFGMTWWIFIVSWSLLI